MQPGSVDWLSQGWPGKQIFPGAGQEHTLLRSGGPSIADPSPTRRGQAGVIRPYRSRAGCAATPAAAGATHVTSDGSLALDASVDLAGEVPVAKFGQRE